MAWLDLPLAELPDSAAADTVVCAFAFACATGREVANFIPDGLRMGAEVVSVECDQCGKEFARSPGDHKRSERAGYRRTCSKACKDKARRRR